MPDGNAEKGRKAETPAKTDKPRKGRRSAETLREPSPAGGKYRAEMPGGNTDREQRAEIPGGNNENEKTFFNELL